jgi:hypothetical protein
MRFAAPTVTAEMGTIRRVTMTLGKMNRIRSLALGLFAGLALYVAAPGCATTGSELQASLTNSNKKPDGQPCQRDVDCVNQCLTASEAAAQPTTQPNTCGRTIRVSN